MTKARTHNRTRRGHATRAKGLTLANGNRLSHGQLFPARKEDDMQQNPQRRRNSSMPRLNVGTLPAAPQRSASGGDHNIARSGAEKRIVDAPNHPNAKRQTSGELHPWLHSQPLSDESEPPLKSYERKIPVHPGMTDKQRATVHPIANDPGEILRDAAALARRPKPKPAEKA